MKQWTVSLIQVTPRLSLVNIRSSGKSPRSNKDRTQNGSGNRAYLKALLLCSYVQGLGLFSMKHNFFVRAQHVPGVSNCIADPSPVFRFSVSRIWPPMQTFGPVPSRILFTHVQYWRLDMSRKYVYQPFPLDKYCGQVVE